MSGASPLDRLVEFYTLRRARSAQEKLGSTRAELEGIVELGRQRASAAEALFSVGHTVEALRLGLEALDATRDAAERYATAMAAPSAPKPAKAPEPPPEKTDDAGKETSADAEPDADAKAEKPDEKSADEKPADEPADEKLAETGEPAPSRPKATWRDAAVGALVPAAAIEATERALSEAEKLAVPKLEAEVTPAHATLFREIMRARVVLASVVAPATQSRAEIGFTRFWRPFVTAVLVLGALYGLLTSMRPVEGTFVRASGIWAESPDFQPTNTIDGNDDSMWLLPYGDGWLEVRFVPTRRIDHISLVNAGSARVLDRSTQDYTLEIWAHGEIARSIDGTFPEELNGHMEHDIGVDAVERIRFVARTTNRTSSGLSEIRWE